MKHSKILSPTRSIALLVLAGAMTLPLQGCNEELEAGDESGAGTERKLVEDYKASTIAEIVMGGRMYDNWMTEMGAAIPAVNNPLNAFAANSTGTTDKTDALNGLSFEKQYRCKTCHGWTYEGDNGFGGVMDASDNLSIEEIESVITNGFTDIAGNSLHQFPSINATMVTALAKFIKYGVVDTGKYITSATGAGRGDPANGETLYKGAGGCASASCHDDDGRGIDFEGDGAGVGDDEFIGTIGQDNAWEMLHKIRFGHAGETGMPDGYASGLSTQDSADIMTHTQFLPSN